MLTVITKSTNGEKLEKTKQNNPDPAEHFQGNKDLVTP